MQRIDLTGRKFNQLLVLGLSSNQKGKQLLWECKCDCGNLVNMTGPNLKGSPSRKGNISCRECLYTKRPSAKRHGMTTTRFANIWSRMKQRATNPKYTYAYDYSGRGITICDRWKDSFENFRDDMYEPYLKHVEEFGEKNTSIERIDNDGNYEPSNCKWATRAEQRRNTRDSHYVTFNGETKILDDWAIKLGFRNGSVIGRRLRRGWPIEDALTIPILFNGKKHKYDIIKTTNN